jgi:hypothetical protein
MRNDQPSGAAGVTRGRRGGTPHRECRLSGTHDEDRADVATDLAACRVRQHESVVTPPEACLHEARGIHRHERGIETRAGVGAQRSARHAPPLDAARGRL